MGTKSQSFSLLLIVIIIASSLMIIQTTSAQSIPKPSVPTFTVQYITYTSYKAPTSTINPYTGQNETTSSGQQIDNQTMKFTIKNQPFTPYTDSTGNYIGIYYNFRFKGHYGDEWTYYPFYVFTNSKTNMSQVQTTHSYGPYSGGFFIYYNASNLEYTLISINLNTLTNYPVGSGIPDNSQVDFEVQAQIGQINPIPSGLLAGDFYNFTGKSSDWSNAETLTLKYNSNSTASTATSPNPTPSPTVPNNSISGNQQLINIALIVAVVVLAIAVISLVVYVRKIKSRTNQQPKQ